jgi:hypothetical protein
MRCASDEPLSDIELYTANFARAGWNLTELVSMARGSCSCFGMHLDIPHDYSCDVYY